jgi:Na+/H+ antiporter NhaD/arsenite permease-like protein
VVRLNHGHSRVEFRVIFIMPLNTAGGATEFSNLFNLSVHFYKSICFILFLLSQTCFEKWINFPRHHVIGEKN